ncbi:uncharacterized protein LOC118508096 [Anopheles stephensi]|uniref:uncharacterized protein LOC118508096 n=1 Tax=Anopheles stephensi TaxID=30069 RepID=UPI001658A7ED|nr:uncharacterized protein LOC118508096 [Anopheles stephensi]
MASATKTIVGVSCLLALALALSHSAEAARCDGLPGGTLLVHEDFTACNRYVACQHEVDHEWFCPPGEFFNARNLQCESSCPMERERSWCGGVPDGVFIRVPPTEPANCQNYYTCFGGNMYLNTCPPGFFFSQVLQACGVNQADC